MSSAAVSNELSLKTVSQLSTLHFCHLSKENLFLFTFCQVNLENYIPESFVKGSVVMLPVLQTTLTWQGLTVRAKEKKILQNISGYCKPGELLTIMGSSGAGKTTLLSLLAGKHSKSLDIEGKVKANNLPFSGDEFYNFGVYIYQNDILHEMLTVRQTLLFIARLRIKDDQYAEDRVNELINSFELQKCQNTNVGGNLMKGISGGEKKRLCIAVEMITKPSVLILDEPTSGLDSSKARSVINILKKLATEENKTVIMTLHQPSFLIYNSLDRLILLNKGRLIYQGSSKAVYDYMQKDLLINVPSNCTISDFFIMEISEYKALKQTNYETPFNADQYSKRLEPLVRKELESAEKEAEVENTNQLEAVRSLGFMFQMLLWREWVIFRRSPMKGVKVIANSVLMVVMAGLIFLDGISDGRPTEGRVYQFRELEIYFIKVQGVCFIATVSCIMTGIFSVTLTFPNEREIYYKETVSKKYRSIAYLIAKIIVEAGSNIVGAIIFSVGNYLLVGYTLSALGILQYTIVLTCSTLVGNSIGLMLGSLFKDASRASALSNILLLPLMMFSGLYNRLDGIPIWIRWLQYISPFRYGLHSILLTEFKDETYLTPSGAVFDYREELLININYEGNVLILMGLSVMYYTLTFILLKQLSTNLAP